NLNQDKATKPQTVQIVRQGEATPYWFKVNPLYLGSSEMPFPPKRKISDDLFTNERFRAAMFGVNPVFPKIYCCRLFGLAPA
ncbi:MAG: hypothetical protein E6899_07810, partial [Neisseria sp.]|nr:hypothetical protein [Neisseria sp.]